MKKLVVALATRKRPKVLVEAVKRFVELAELPETQIVVLADSDDPETLEAMHNAKLGERVVLSFEAREDTLGEKYNRVLKVAPGADVYQVAVDYAMMHTKGYDRKVLEAAGLFPDGIGCVYGPPANASFPTIQAPTAKLIELLGGIYPPYFPFWFVDHWLDDICKAIDRIATVELEVDCNSNRGPVTTELRDVAFWATLFDTASLHRRMTAERIIKEHLLEPGWRKKLMLGGWSRIDLYSKYVNQGVRAQAQQIEASRGEKSPPDVRYQRVLEAGQKALQKFGSESALPPENVPQQDFKELSWLLSHIRGVKSILEIGSCYGALLRTLASAAAPQAKLRAIDLGVLPRSRDKLEETTADLTAQGYDAKVFFGCSHSLEAVAWAKNEGPFDVVFIDGDHSYEGVRQDWVNYGQLGKLVVFHDIVHPHEEVKKLWQELKAQHPTISKVESKMGLGVVFRAA